MCIQYISRTHQKKIYIVGKLLLLCLIRAHVNFVHARKMVSNEDGDDGQANKKKGKQNLIRRQGLMSSTADNHTKRGCLGGLLLVAARLVDKTMRCVNRYKEEKTHPLSTKNNNCDSISWMLIDDQPFVIVRRNKNRQRYKRQLILMWFGGKRVERVLLFLHEKKNLQQ